MEYQQKNRQEKCIEEIYNDSEICSEGFLYMELKLVHGTESNFFKTLQPLNRIEICYQRFKQMA